MKSKYVENMNIGKGRGKLHIPLIEKQALSQSIAHRKKANKGDKNPY